MTLNKLASLIAKREGKRSQAHIGDVREILGILGDLFYAELTANGWAIDREVKAIDVALYLAGEKRAKRAKKVKR